jgi:hypothetical protein
MRAELVAGAQRLEGEQQEAHAALHARTRVAKEASNMELYQLRSAEQGELQQMQAHRREAAEQEKLRLRACCAPYRPCLC